MKPDAAIRLRILKHNCTLAYYQKYSCESQRYGPPVRIQYLTVAYVIDMAPTEENRLKKVREKSANIVLGTAAHYWTLEQNVLLRNKNKNARTKSGAYQLLLCWKSSGGIKPNYCNDVTQRGLNCGTFAAFYLVWLLFMT